MCHVIVLPYLTGLTHSTEPAGQGTYFALTTLLFTSPSLSLKTQRLLVYLGHRAGSGKVLRQ